MVRGTVSAKAERALREIGLTEYECMAYISLVQTGELTANEVSTQTSIPYSKVYTVLDTLEKKGWVEFKGGRPRLYYPKSPLEALRVERARQEAKFEESSGQVVTELQALYEHREIKEKPEIWIIRGEENVVAKIRDVVQSAKRELMMALPMVPPQVLKKLIPTLLVTRDKKIALQLLTTNDTRSLFPEILLNLAEVRIRDDMFGGGLVADGRETLLFLGQGALHDENLAIWSDHVGLNMVSRGYFKYLWDTSHNIN